MAENQGALMKSRGVAPIVLAGLELIHQIIHAPKSNKHMINIAIKLDLSKAFDRIKWSFVLQIIDKLAFPHHFIKLIEFCLNSTSIFIRYNQTKTSYFDPS